MANPIVTGLTSYVEENKSKLIAKSVLGGKSASMFNLMVDVKGPTTVNKVGTNVVLQDGSDCGWSASGTTELSQRTLTPAHLKVNMPYCEKELLKTFAQHQVKVAAGQKNLPFEEEFMNSVANDVQEQIEKMIYQGQSGQTDEFEGLISILSGATGVVTSTSASGVSAYNAIKAVYMAIPERAIKEDTVILVSAGMFREFIQDLVNANLYHFNPNDKDGEYTLPGTNVKVLLTNGLNDTSSYDYIIAGRLSNLFYGISGNDDDETFDFWYSKDNQEWRLAMEFIAGTQVAYPNEIVFGKRAK